MDPLILPLLLIAALALPLILGSRRQKRALADAQQLQDSLTVGDRVMTTSGLQATVVSTSDERTVDLEIAPGVRTTWSRMAIREKLADDVPADAAAGGSDGAGDVSERRGSPLEDGARTDRL